MTHVMACIDNSQSSLAVCDYAAWASQRLSAPLTLLHVLDKEKYPASADLSGNIGLGSREHLLEELATLDAQRAKLALEHGQHMLEKARERTVISGAMSPDLKQRHGHLVESRVRPPDFTLMIDWPIMAQPAMPPSMPAAMLATPCLCRRSSRHDLGGYRRHGTSHGHSG